MTTVASNLPPEAAHPGTPEVGRARVSLGKRLLFSLLTFAVVWIALMILGEIVLRLVGWPAAGYYLNGRGPLEMSAPGEANGRYPASENGEIRAFEFSHPWKTNSLGFRDRELTPKQPGEHRIGLIGDSMVAGHGVEQNERFMELWFNALKDKPENVSIWNLGISGTGTCDQASSIAKLVDLCELDEVILGLYSGNELADNELWLNTKELQEKIKRGEAQPSSHQSSSLRGWLRENSRLATYMWVHSVQYLANKFSPRDDLSTHFQRMWPTTEEGLNRFKEAVGDRQLTIWYLPGTSEWDNEYWQTIKVAQNLRDEDRFAMRDAVVAWAAKNKVSLVDLTPVLLGRDRAEVKFRVDGHWNASGHRLVAEALSADTNASYLQRQLIGQNVSHKAPEPEPTSP